MEKPKWTIGTVNWKSIDFVEYQLKYFHEYNQDFEFIVCDNESNVETPKFKDLKEKYPKLKLINQHWKIASWSAHGIGLNQCIKSAEGKYILLMDPDFFWMKKDILSFLEYYFDQGYHAIGADYMHTTTSFPMIWGGSYVTNEIKDLDLLTRNPRCESCKNWIHDRDYDTGWQIRIRLSNKPHYSFRQIQNQVPNFGRYNDRESETYVYDTKVIAHHLRSGSQIEEDYKEEKIKEIREKYTEWMWSQLYD